MTGKAGKSGGARRGAGRAPVLKFRNRQTVRVAGLWGYDPDDRRASWRDATISIRRAMPDRIQMDISDEDKVVHLIIVISPPRPRRPAKK